MGEVEPPDPWRFERKARERGCCLIAGVDEAGRGPLAGPVVAAAVVLPANFRADGVRDSKRMTALQREEAFARIIEGAVSVGVGKSGPEEIDRINILQATYSAMRQAIDSLCVEVDRVLVDGRPIPGLSICQEGIPHGDALCVSISAASIIAKVTRDRIMEELDGLYPGYGFARHKGYLTPEHLTAICRLGACAIHRRTFSPISEEVNPSCRQESLF